MKPKFSICIPNFNYEHYIDITLTSVHHQLYDNFEVLISDNASTDKSIEVIKKHAIADSRVSYRAKPSNIGFAGNLDEAGRMAQGNWMIMLSSDDVMNNNALAEYNKFIQLIPKEQTFAFSSTFEKIDSAGNFIEFLGPNSLWNNDDIDEQLTNQMGLTIYKVNAAEMLKRSITKFLNPFNFASTCYLQATYTKVGGYGGGRLYNPDKWFHWKILAEVDFVYFIDAPLFQYRWHNTNQAAQQSQSQILKYWMDEYRNCFEISDSFLLKTGLHANAIPQYFIDRCIVPYVFNYLKQGQIVMAKRLLNFGLSCYPNQLKKNKYYYPLYIISRIPFSYKLLKLIPH